MRITRTHYAIGTILASGILTMLGNIIADPVGFLVIGLIIIGIQIYLAVGRLRDMDKNPWLAALTILPLVGFILMFPKGTKGANRYGEDPRVKQGG